MTSPIHPSRQEADNPPSQPAPDLSIFRRVWNYFYPPVLPPRAPRVITQLHPPSPIRLEKTERPAATVFTPIEPLYIRPTPPTFVPYSIKISLLNRETRDFKINTLEEEERAIQELTMLLDETLDPIRILEGIHNKEFSEVMKSSRPDFMRVRELFEEHFALSEPSSYQQIITPKILKEEDWGDGVTRITYQNGKIKTILQPYSEVRHPWARKLIEQGIELPPNANEELQKALPKLMQPNGNVSEEGSDGIKRFNGANLIFSLDAVPGVIFKRAQMGLSSMNPDPTEGNLETAERFEKMVKAQFVCQALNLDHLVVPSARTIQVEYQGKQYLFIAEEQLDVDANHSAQEECYKKYTCEMDELIRQLILFIEHTKMSDISWRNIPLLNNNVAKVGLIDLDRIDTSVSRGLLGAGEGPERGLLNCLFSEKQIDAVLKAVRPYDVDNRADRMKERRLEELREEARLDQFHFEKGLQNEPRRLIRVDDWEKLGLNLEETYPYFARTADPDAPPKIITLREAVEDVVKAINDGIQNASPKASTKGIRCVFLNIDECMNAWFKEQDQDKARFLSRLGEYGRYCVSHNAGQNVFKLSEEEQSRYLWLDRIARALVQAGHLCHFRKNHSG